MAVATLPTTLPGAHIAGTVYEFERAFNPFTRQNGWRPLGIPDFDPVAPPMCVHDLLEHFPELGSDVYAEYMALGAAHWIRGKGGYFHEQGTTISNALVAPAFGMLFHHIHQHNLPTEPAPMVAEAFYPVDPYPAENAILQTLVNAREFLRRTYDAHVIDASLKEALGWMRIGYRRAAEERYAGQRAKDLSKLFFQAQKRIDREASNFQLANRGQEPSILRLELDPVQYTYQVTVA